MVEMADVAKISKSADFTGALRGNEWCCQTGLNCLPLHYQWSARVLEIPRADNNLSNFKSRPCDTFVPVGQAKCIVIDDIDPHHGSAGILAGPPVLLLLKL